MVLHFHICYTLAEHYVAAVLLDLSLITLCNAVAPPPHLPCAPRALWCSHLARLLTIRCIQTQACLHVYQLTTLFTDSSPHQTCICPATTPCMCKQITTGCISTWVCS